jgi:hypothetical protein
MKIERFLIQGCCGRKQIVFKLDRPLAVELLEVLKSNGFTEAPNFAKAGMIYADNKDLIVSGPVGGDKLNVKCKHREDECNQYLNDLEALLIRTE